MATLVKNGQGFFQSGPNGLVPITDPVQLRDLNSGNTKYIDQTTGADVLSPTGTKSSGPQAPVTPDPYTVFNKNVGKMLTYIQGMQSNAGTNIGGAVNTLTNLSVSPNGSAPANPGVFSNSQVQGQETLQDAFKPAITSLNTQLQNENAGLSLLSGNLKDLAQIYAPQAIQPGMSLVTPDGKVIKQGHAYTPQINTLTGLMDGFDTTSGTWASQDTGIGGETTPVTATHQGSVIVGGIDFGTTATGIKPYATDPNYANSVNTMYNSIKASEGQNGGIATPVSIDAYIKAHSGSSPVTGQMILNAAAQYQVDPNILAAVLGHESGFGTAGTAVKTMNPGNVGNTDNGSTQTFKSWPQGVNAAAQELARRKVTPESVQQKTDTGLARDNSQSLQAFKSQLPITIQNGARQTANGLKYIDLGEVADVPTAKSFAARLGVKAFDSNDASGIQALDTISQSLNAMTLLAQQQLEPANGGIGTGTNFTKNYIGTLLGTNAKLSDFGVNKDSAIKAVTALAGGAGSGLRLNTSTIAAAVSNLPTMYDSREVALEKIDKTRDLLNTQLGTAFGNPAIGNGVIQYNGHTYNAGDFVVNNKGQVGTVNQDGSISLQ